MGGADLWTQWESRPALISPGTLPVELILLYMNVYKYDIVLSKWLAERPHHLRNLSLNVDITKLLWKWDYATWCNTKPPQIPQVGTKIPPPERGVADKTEPAAVLTHCSHFHHMTFSQWNVRFLPEYTVTKMKVWVREPVPEKCW